MYEQEQKVYESSHISVRYKILAARVSQYDVIWDIGLPHNT